MVTRLCIESTISKGEAPALTLEDIDPKIEARLRRKFDARVLTSVTMLYLWAFLTRANIGNAKVLGLQDELDLGEDNKMNMTNTFITLLSFYRPVNVLVRKFGPRTMLPLICTICGFLTISNAFVNNFGGLFAIRFLIGISQAAIMPGISYALGTFYRRHELITRVGVYASCASVAGAFSGLLVIGFSKIPAWGIIHSWRNIFFFEGIIMMIISVAMYFVMPDSPGNCTFLTEEERRIGVLRIQLEQLSAGKKEAITREHFKTAMLNINTWLMGLGLFGSLLSMNSIALFMPSLLSEFGWNSVVTQIMTVPPYAFACIICIGCSILSDRWHTRGIFMFALCAPLTIIGFAVLLTVDGIGPRYMAIFFATGGGFTCSPIFVGWSVDNTAGPTVRSIACAFIISLGELAGIVSSWTYLPSQAPEYTTGNQINLAMGALVLVCAAACSFYMKWENTQRDKGKRDHVLHGLSQDQIDQLGHKHPQFRFTP
ncbi:MFS general substrate transporter [Lichtheimia hyalospora FSU 10163]|nr:MFS general substrate transporter [Lichtheimia hyalospora FSU 10163]